MKKLIFGLMVILMGLLLMVPMASATPLGQGEMTVYSSGPVIDNLYGDYDGIVTWSNFGYSIPLSEIFCVSGDQNFGNPYDFYAIDNSLEAGLFAKLSQAAWIGDNYIPLYGSTDAVKASAQAAVWTVMGVGDYSSYSLEAAALIVAAAAHSGEANSNWLFAANPVGGGIGEGYQDFITPNPVPIPAAVWLLGSGLLGLVGIRRRFKK